jgi:hypothetical protein
MSKHDYIEVSFITSMGHGIVTAPEPIENFSMDILIRNKEVIYEGIMNRWVLTKKGEKCLQDLIQHKKDSELARKAKIEQVCTHGWTE